MKQEIMEKLFAEKPLSNEEILYIGSQLKDEIPQDSNNDVKAKKVGVIPYNHTVKDSLSKACGLVEDDFNKINKLIRSEIMDRTDELDCDSKQIEVYEKIASVRPQNFRMMMYQYMKFKRMIEKSQTGGGTFRFGGSGDLGDFLDFLRRGGPGG